MWKMIDGYFWPYRINEEAVIERQLDSGRWKEIKKGINWKTRQVYVRLKDKNGVRRRVYVKRLMADIFLGGYKKGMVLSNRDGMTSDVSLNNLVWETQHSIGKRYGGGGRRSVEKIDREGNVIDLYRSISEAAKKNFISRKSVYIRCHNKLKMEDPFLLLGFSFRFEK